MRKGDSADIRKTIALRRVAIIFLISTLRIGMTELCGNQNPHPVVKNVTRMGHPSCQVTSSPSAQEFQLAAPVQVVNELAGVAPAGLDFDEKFQEDFGANHFFDLQAGGGA